MSELSTHDKAVLNCIFNPNLPLTEAYEEELCPTIKDIEEDTPEIKNAKVMEVDAINKAENGDLDGALSIFNAAIAIAPNKASLYNNRAQVYQLKSFGNEALEDLSKSIELAQNNQKRTLCQALCQRGLLYRKSEDVEMAKQDFEQAAKLGSQFAKSQLIEMNPYAALCNQMLRQVMKDLK